MLSFPENNSNILRKFNLFDLIVVLIFVIFSSLYQINRVTGNSSFLFYATDTASLAGFTAASDHPELFVGDELLGNENNFNFYSTIQLPLVRVISRFTGDYASAFTFLLWFHNLLLPIGFYLLGRVIFQNRYWAALLAVLNVSPFPLAITEFWGIFCDFLPRISFHTLLPFLLAALIHWRFKPVVWPMILLITGFSMYIYPASVPTWGLSIWLSSLLFLPASWNIFRRAGFILFSGVIFLLGALPFSVNYLSHHVHGYTENYNFVYEIMNYRYPNEVFNAILAFRSFFANPAFLRIVILGLIGIIYVWFYYRAERKKIALVCMWILGILITSLILPFVEQIISRKYKTVSLEIELIRNSKYLFPLMLIFCLWPFAVITKNTSNAKVRRAAFILGFFLVFIWSGRQMYKHTVFLNENGLFLFNPDKAKASETIDALNAIKRLSPPGSRFLVLASFPELAIRYYALRPLVYSYKNGASFIYTNHAELIKWYEKAKQLDRLRDSLAKEYDDNVKLKLVTDISRRFNAEFLLIDRKEISDALIFSRKDIVYYNNLYVLMKINEEVKMGAR